MVKTLVEQIPRIRTATITTSSIAIFFLARVAAAYRFLLLSHWLILVDKISGMSGLVM
jgi:hypothetical protein